MFELADHGIKSAILMLLRALISDDCVRLLRDMPHERFAEMRFANSRLATDETDLAFAALGLVPERQQLLQLLVAADKPRKLVRTLRLETALHRSPPRNTGCADRFRKAGNYVLLGIAANENTAEESARTRSDEDRVGSCQIAQPYSNGWGSADGVVLTG